MYRCVGASTEGFRVPSTILPSRSTITWSAGVRSSNFTPEGLMTTRPVFVSRTLTLPEVHVTRPCRGSSQLSRQTSARSSGSRCFRPAFALAMLGAFRGGGLDGLEPLHDVVGAPAEVVVQRGVLREELPVRGVFLVPRP